MHIFNDVIWPDFSRIPTPEAPFVSFHEIRVGQTLQLGGKVVEVLPAVHTVPAVGFSVTAGQGCWVLADELDCIAPGATYPIYITHTKPAETELIMAEIQFFDQTLANGSHVAHDIRWLRAGQEFEL